jgi:transposase
MGRQICLSLWAAASGHPYFQLNRFQRRGPLAPPLTHSIYNQSGLEGLADRPRRNGPRPRLSAEQQAKVAQWVEQGPDLERDGVVRWRCVDLQQRITQEFAVTLHERTVGKLLRKLSFRRLSVRPQHPQSAPEEQSVFRAALPIS